MRSFLELQDGVDRLVQGVEVDNVHQIAVGFMGGYKTLASHNRQCVFKLGHCRSDARMSCLLAHCCSDSLDVTSQWSGHGIVVTTDDNNGVPR